MLIVKQFQNELSFLINLKRLNCSNYSSAIEGEKIFSYPNYYNNLLLLKMENSSIEYFNPSLGLSHMNLSLWSMSNFHVWLADTLL